MIVCNEQKRFMPLITKFWQISSTVINNTISYGIIITNFKMRYIWSLYYTCITLNALYISWNFLFSTELEIRF